MAVKSYIAVSSDSTKVAITTDDGHTWTTTYNGTSLCGTITSSSSHLYKSIASGIPSPTYPRQYVIIGSSGYAYSLDAISWTIKTWEGFSSRSIINDGVYFGFTKPNLQDSNFLDFCYFNADLSSYYVAASAAIPVAGYQSMDAAPQNISPGSGPIMIAGVESNRLAIRSSTDHGFTWTLSYNPTTTITKLSNIVYYDYNRFLVIGQGSTATSFYIFKYNAGTWSSLATTASTSYSASTINLAARYIGGLGLHEYSIMPIDSTILSYWAGDPDSSSLTNRSFGSSIAVKRINNLKDVSANVSSTFFISKTTNSHYSTDNTSWTSGTTPFAFGEVQSYTPTINENVSTTSYTSIVNNNLGQYPNVISTTSNTTTSLSRDFIDRDIGIITSNVSIVDANIGNFNTPTINLSTTTTIVPPVFSKVTSNVTVSKTDNRFWSNPWSMIYAESKWVGVKNGSNTASTSTDGATFTARTLPSSDHWNGITHDGTTFVTIAEDSNKAAYSADGITWTASTLPTTRKWHSLVAGGTTIVAVSLESDYCAVSTDHGATWTEYAMPVSANWTGIAWNGSVFCAITDSDVAATSSDGQTWTQRTMPSNIHYNAIAYGLGTFMAVASGTTPGATTNKAATSADGITWTEVTMPQAAEWTTIGQGIGDPNV